MTGPSPDDPTRWEVATPGGPARVHLHAVPHGRPRATLVLGHGAGRTGPDAADLVALATSLPGDGIEVVLVEQPWHVAGSRVAGPPKTLDTAWRACLDDLRGRGIGTLRLVVGGRSAGARVACRTAASVQPAALFLLAFPARPIRRASAVTPPPSRLPELVAAASLAPTVVVQGDADRMGDPVEIATALAEAATTARVVPVAGADHSFRVRGGGARQEEAMTLLVRAGRATALGILDGRY